MTDKKSRWSTDEKFRIVLQAMDPQANAADICRENNLVPRALYNWKDKFLAGGRGALDGSDAAAMVKRHKKEVSSLKRLTDQYAVANAAFKKTMEGDGDRASRARLPTWWARERPLHCPESPGTPGTTPRGPDTYKPIPLCRRPYVA